MKRKPTPQSNILKSWEANASAWVNSIDKKEIESRQLLTNDAILKAIQQNKPKEVLDAGCGEGWLVRTLMDKGINAYGFDGSKKLIAQAKKINKGVFFHINYDEIIQGENQSLDVYDVVVFNYSIFEKENVDKLLQKIKLHLKPLGVIIIQTISDRNPLFSLRDKTGWMKEDWKSFKTIYPASFNWYYRSNEEWETEFSNAGLSVLEKIENIHPKTHEYFSVIYVLK